MRPGVKASALATPVQVRNLRREIPDRSVLSGLIRSVFGTGAADQRDLSSPRHRGEGQPKADRRPDVTTGHR
jgi:hypothetical protein